MGNTAGIGNSKAISMIKVANVVVIVVLVVPLNEDDGNWDRAEQE
jgi:hypothetical protein